MPKEVTLTLDDWVEIYYALHSKQLAVVTGAYGPEERPGATRKWAEHLATIMARIGADGAKAAENGVAPA